MAEIITYYKCEKCHHVYERIDDAHECEDIHVDLNNYTLETFYSTGAKYPNNIKITSSNGTKLTYDLVLTSKENGE